MVGSMQWTDEETAYLRAILTWQSKPERKRASSRLSNLGIPEQRDEKQNHVVGDLRILVVGAEGCGKTSILTRFCLCAFRKDTEAAKLGGHSCRRLVDVGGQSYVADVLDLTAEHVSVDQMLERAINITEGAVMVYDVTNRDSLALAVRIQHFIRDVVGPRGYGLLLVGTKNDVGEEAGRVIPAAEGARVAASFDMECGFMEASSRTGENVAAIFPALGQEILRLKLLAREQREEGEMATILQLKLQTGAVARRKRGFWKTIASPFFRRRRSMRS